MSVRLAFVCRWPLHVCTLHCVYCFEKHKSDSPSKRMRFETAVAVLEPELAAFGANRARANASPWSS